MAKTLSNLTWPDGQTNPSGTKAIAYYVRKADILTFPKFPAAPASSSDAVSYEDDFELVASANFITIYSTQGTGKLEFEPTGEKDCKMFNNKLTMTYPDLNDDSLDFSNTVLNSNGIFIVPHFQGGGKVAYAVIGGEHFDCDVSAKGTTGDKPGSQKGLTTEVTAPDFYALPRYKGLIKTDKGTLNCATGEFTLKA